MSLWDLSVLPDGVRLGVNPLSWANDVLEDLGADIPLETCLADAAAVGYRGIELGRKFPRQRTVLVPLLERHGLDLVSGWHSGRLAEGDVDAEVDAVAAHAELLASMGCSVMVYGETAMMASLDASMSQRLVMPAANVAAYGQRLGEFARRLHGDYGLRLAYHHHLMMVAETFDETRRLFDATARDVGLLLDTGHATAGGFGYADLIDGYGDRIVHIHLKDVRSDRLADVRARDASFNDGVRAGMFTVPGDGEVDFAPLADFVTRSGYSGWLVVEAEQDPALAPPRPAVERAFTHVLQTFAASKGRS
ncbi:myo-inosose-2 dehydratase [Aureimonas sp. ME7]|uniref:myo-inosose-2 dehydratase n=1 Tax=Aureimonas sp. ME7 TaxID=2744252 RepID=UPI0015F54FF9|nr:myo-inosose-2 dehydratase [Aureimonas sp. ME7]